MIYVINPSSEEPLFLRLDGLDVVANFSPSNIQKFCINYKGWVN